MLSKGLHHIESKDGMGADLKSFCSEISEVSIRTNKVSANQLERYVKNTANLAQRYET